MEKTKPLQPPPHKKKYKDEKVDVTEFGQNLSLHNLKDVFIDTCTCHVLGKQIRRRRLRRFETFDFLLFVRRQHKTSSDETIFIQFGFPITRI